MPIHELIPIMYYHLNTALIMNYLMYSSISIDKPIIINRIVVKNDQIYYLNSTF